MFSPLFVLSRLYARLLRRSNEQCRSTISILSPSWIQFFRIREIFLVIDFELMRPFSELVASISWSTAIRARDSSLLRKLLLGNSRSSFEISVWSGNFEDTAPRWDNSELSCHLRTSPNTQGMVSHRHKTYLSSRLFLLLALTEKQGKNIDCNDSSLTIFLNSFYSQNRQ